MSVTICLQQNDDIFLICQKMSGGKRFLMGPSRKDVRGRAEGLSAQIGQVKELM